jgi:hypothetical protein
MYNYNNSIEDFDFDKQIEIDRMNYMAEGTMFLSESIRAEKLKRDLKKGYKFITDDKKNLNLNVNKLDVNKLIDLGVDAGAKLINSNRKVSQSIIKETRKMLDKSKNIENNLVINGYSKELNTIIQLISISADVTVFAIDPVVGIINAVTKRYIKKEKLKSDIKKKYKLKREFEGELKVINARINDLEGSTSEKDRKYKYELIKLKNTLESNIDLLEHGMNVNRSKLGLDKVPRGNYYLDKES